MVMAKMQQPKNRKKKMTRRSQGSKARHLAAEVLRTIAVVYAYKGPDTVSRHYCLKNNRFIPTTEAIGAACHFPQRWVVTVSLILKERNGKIKIVSEQTAPRDENGKVAPVDFTELQAFLGDQHRRMIRENPHPDNLVNVAWIATANGQELGEEREFRIYQQAGAWENYIAHWERKEYENKNIGIEVIQ